MKIDKTALVGLLVALGFTKAGTWSDEKLRERGSQIPEKVTEDDVPEGFEDLYSALAEGGEIEFSNGAEKGDGLEGLDRSALKALIEERELPVKPSKHKKDSELRKAVAAALEKVEKPKAEKKKAEKPAKAEKPKAEKKEVERDAFGCRVGTISAEVNSVLANEWKSEEEIAEEAGVTLVQAQGRLYYATEKGLLVRRRRTEYKLVKK